LILLNDGTAMDVFTLKIEKTIESYKLFRPGSRLLVGVSGGADSVALVHVLQELADKWRLRLRLLHVNHSLRGAESDADERFVKALARRLGLPVICERLDLRKLRRTPHTSLEERCRQERYHCYVEHARCYRADGIVLAHHKDDLAETVLMRMLRGAGSHGLAAFLPKTRYQGVGILRPFYDVTRDEIRRFLKSRTIAWREDSSNRNMRFLRNKVRSTLIPFLQKEFNPAIADVLARTAQLFRIEDEYLERQTKHIFDHHVVRGDNDILCLPIKFMLTLDPALHQRLIRLAFTELTGLPYGPEHAQVEMLTRAIQTRQTGQLIRCADNILVYISYCHIIFTRLSVPRQLGKDLLLQKLFEVLRRNMLLETIQPLLSSPTRKIRISRSSFRRPNTTVTHRLNGWVIELRRVRATASLRKRIRRQTSGSSLSQYYDFARLNFPLLIRSRRTGDRFQPFGSAASQRLKHFFINMKIPLYLRDHVPLLCDRENILWVIGVRRANAASIGPDTKEAIRIELHHFKNTPSPMKV
jgi:tRNA(Ile)-lysidine synthase